MPVTIKQGGQATPAGTSAVSIYTVPASTEATVLSMTVTNVTTTNARFSIYIDVDGSTYDDTTKVYNEAQLLGRSTFTDLARRGMQTVGGNIAVETDTVDALTFTVDIVEFT